MDDMSDRLHRGPSNDFETGERGSVTACTRGGRSPARAVPGTDPHPPDEVRAAAERLFGDRLPLAVRYAALLINEGVTRGLVGPREAPRIWERHLLNCAAVAELVPPDARVIDVGSGAGLPGIVLAVARPDVSVILLEPLARRSAFLTGAVSALGLERATVVRARAEECTPERGRIDHADVVTARAVASLDRLAAWCLPLARVGGRVLAVKGESADEEVAAHRDTIGELGGGTPWIQRCGLGLLVSPTTVVVIARERPSHGPTGRKARRKK